MTRAAIIVQRYGAAIVGGAESHARQIAAHLAQDLQWEIEIFTTTCKDYETWDRHYEAGRHIEENEIIHRFHPDRQRSKLFSWFNKLLTPLILFLPQKNLLRKKLEQIWFTLQGPTSQPLFEHAIAQQKKFDVMVFFSAIYPITNQLIDKLDTKTVIIPTLHDEAALYFSRTRLALEAATKVFLNSKTEAALLKKVVTKPVSSAIVGLGFDQLTTNETLTNIRPCPEPYVLYLGRVGAGKRVHDLITGHEIYTQNRSSKKLKLVLVGQQEHGFQIPKNQQIIYSGFLDEQTKNAYIQNSEAIVSASHLESLSMILFEAIQLGTPAIMSAQSPLMQNFSEQMPAIRCFQNPEELAQQLEQLQQESSEDSTMTKQKIKDSQRWANEHFSWQKVLEHYAQLT